MGQAQVFEGRMEEADGAVLFAEKQVIAVAIPGMLWKPVPQSFPYIDLSFKVDAHCQYNFFLRLSLVFL